MKKESRIEKKYHYILKYVVLALPILLLLISVLLPKKTIENNYNVDDSITTQETIYTDVDFNQLNNYEYNMSNYITIVDVEGSRYDRSLSVSTLTENHFYIFRAYVYYNLSDVNLYLHDATWHYNDIQKSINSLGFISSKILCDGTHNVQVVLDTISSISGHIEIKLAYNVFDLTKMGLENISIDDFNKMFPLPSYFYTTSDVISVDTLKITETINDNSSLIDVYESKQLNDVLLMPLINFYDMPINNWYWSILDLLNITYVDLFIKYLFGYILYIFYVYLFDIVLDCLVAIPKLIHNLFNKLGGE